MVGRIEDTFVEVNTLTWHVATPDLAGALHQVAMLTNTKALHYSPTMLHLSYNFDNNTRARHQGHRHHPPSPEPSEAALDGGVDTLSRARAPETRRSLLTIGSRATENQ